MGTEDLYNRVKNTKNLGTIIFVILGIIVIASIYNKKSIKDNNYNNSDTQSSNPILKIGDVLKTEYFDVVVNKISISDKVSTGNEFADKGTEQGNRFLIINVTFKNTDKESRMLFDGSLWINYNGRDYEFDKSETIMYDGWGLFLDQINPLISITTNLVYKIPIEIKGPAFYQPGRSSKSDLIFLGNID
jgi:hypothetical protein